MAIDTEDIFRKCAPAVRTNIDRCGTVSVCSSTIPTTVDELDGIFKSGSSWKILESLFMTQMETKACGSVQNSWEDFFLANMKTVKKGEIQLDSNTRTLTKIRPFLLSKSRTPINNVYWRVANGQTSGGNWQIDVHSTSGIPADIRSFAVGERVYIESRNSGAKNWWNGVVVSRTAVTVSGTDKVRLVLSRQNSGSAFTASADPVTGLLQRGNANVAKTESFCDDEPGYIDTRLTPYWIRPGYRASYWWETSPRATVLRFMTVWARQPIRSTAEAI